VECQTDLLSACDTVWWAGTAEVTFFYSFFGENLIYIAAVAGVVHENLVSLAG
jgi:hypothetical protein